MEGPIFGILQYNKYLLLPFAVIKVYFFVFTSACHFHFFSLSFSSFRFFVA